MKKLFAYFTMSFLLSIGTNVMALSMSNAIFYTDNFSDNTPWGWSTGYLLLTDVLVADAAGEGVPNNISSVQAYYEYNNTNLDLDFDGSHYNHLTTADPSITDYGTTHITATNDQDETASIATNPLRNAAEIPVATNIQFSDYGLTPTISWDQVTYNGGTPVDSYHIRIYQGDSPSIVFRTSGLEGFQNNWFTIPDGFLDYDSDYYVRILANDYGIDQGSSYLENRSSSWMGFSTVNVAPVPEPATMLLFGTGLVGLVGSRLRKKKK